MEGVESSKIREFKLNRAAEFFRHLGNRNLAFAGVSCSVSYTPEENDDIDIFLICRCGKLWFVLLRAFLARRRLRMDDICLSLSMDEKYAGQLFSGDAERVVASDAIHVVPLHGGEYYDGLLSISPFVSKYYPEYHGVPSKRNYSFKKSPGLLDFLAYIFVGPYLIINSLRNNHRCVKLDSGSGFRPRIGLHHFYLDSDKYNGLKLSEGDET